MHRAWSCRFTAPEFGRTRRPIQPAGAAWVRLHQNLSTPMIVRMMPDGPDPAGSGNR
jgi:hypothetical protein